MEESSDIPILLAVKSNGILLAHLFWPVDLDKGTVPDFLICYKGTPLSDSCGNWHIEVGSHVLRTHQSKQRACLVFA